MTITERLKTAINNKNIVENVPMSQFTSFKAGGRADIMVTPEDVFGLASVLTILASEKINYMVLGNGSNVLVRDGGYRGVIVRIGECFSYTHVDEGIIVCGAGTLMSAVSRAAAGACLTGFEFASGIPGTIGGAVFMNAGAYGGETSQVLKKAKILSADGSREYYMTAQDLEMGYRHTILHETGDIVTEVVLELNEGNADEIRSTIAELTSKRNSKQPVSFPSAGSFFKRPEGYFAGTLIQDAGLKGVRVGGAEVSKLHGGFIINKGGATATDIIQLMEIVQAEVMSRFGVKLEPEVRIIGEPK